MPKYHTSRSPHLKGVPDQSPEVYAAIERLSRGCQRPGDRRMAREGILQLREAIKASWDDVTRRSRQVCKPTVVRVEIMQWDGAGIYESEVA